MAKEAYETFGEVRARLDEIVAEVRSKDLSLEKSLDLYEEAIKLGNRCAELVDKPDFTPEEAALANEAIDAAKSTVDLSGSVVSADDEPAELSEGPDDALSGPESEEM